LILAVIVGGAVFGIASAVQASIPDSSGVIHGCYNNSLAHGNPTGALRVIDTAKANGNCASWETPLTWNAQGPTGPTGPPGPTGATGPSDAWDSGGCCADTVPTGGAFVHIPGVSGLTPGSYLLSGHVVWDKLGVGTADLLCFLDTTGLSSVTTAGAGVASTAGGGSAPLGGNGTVSTTGSVGVECQEVSGTVSVNVTVDVQAIKVGTLH
jgi:hypothetical protein